MGVKTIVVDETTDAQYYGQVMRVGKADLGINERGIFDIAVTLSGSGSGVTFGGYALDEYNEDESERVATRYGMDFIMKVLWVFGVDRWSQLLGREVFTLWGSESSLGTSILGIASLDGRRIFIPSLHAERFAWAVAEGAER